MMASREHLRDPNVAAYLAFHGSMRIEVTHGLQTPLSWWGRQFTWSPWRPALEHPPQPYREGNTLYVTAAFRARMEIYLNSYRLEARERRAATLAHPLRREQGEHYG